MLGKLNALGLAPCFIVFFVQVSTSDNTSSELSDLRKLNISCPSYDMCYNATTADYYSSNTFCDCGPSCVRYDTCCIDSPFLKMKRRSDIWEECSTIDHSDLKAFVVSKCSVRWKGSPLIKCKCEMKQTSLRDPLGVNPVTSKTTNTTYKNYFCALCNEDDLNSIPWNVMISFPGSPVLGEPTRNAQSNFLRALEFRSNRNQWGVWKETESKDWKFSPAIITFHPPTEIYSLIKKCRTDMISKCAPSWQEADVRDKCEAYMAPVDVIVPTENHILKTFRNVHCAICNYIVDFTDAMCLVHELKVSRVPSLSLSLLIDVNQSDGDVVGETKRCASSEVYDPFFKKCRALSCVLPGFTLKDGKCTRS